MRGPGPPPGDWREAVPEPSSLGQDSDFSPDITVMTISAIPNMGYAIKRT